jgi:hypothetical protein
VSDNFETFWIRFIDVKLHLVKKLDKNIEPKKSYAKNDFCQNPQYASLPHDM